MAYGRLLITALALSVALPVQALRCGNNLISDGDNPVTVRRYCGEPADVAIRTEYRSVRIYDHYPNLYREAVVPIQIEEWLYNFGPHRFMRRLRFENSRLVDIDTLDYGYRN